MKITLITGFLGSGKTTLVKRLILGNNDQKLLGVIVNDLSDLDVDGELLQLSHSVCEQEGNLITIHGGSISGSQRSAFVSALHHMQSRGIQHLIIETSGASHPAQIIADIQKIPNSTLGAVLTLVDARMLLHDFDSAQDLSTQIRSSATNATQTPATLMLHQLQVASVIALSKVDLVPADKMDIILSSLVKINPLAHFCACSYGKIQPSLIFDAPPYANQHLPHPHSTEEQADTNETYGLDSVTLCDSRPFHPKRFYQLFHERLGLGVFRSKGFIWLASRPAHVLLWNQAGGAMGLELVGIWKAATLEENKLLPEEVDQMQARLATAHPLFGDRANELTVIGTQRDCALFYKELQNCLCTPEEITHWKNRGTFPDPWPKNLRKLT